jgi:hypothetical protein
MHGESKLDPTAKSAPHFYGRALDALEAAGVRFLIGGGFALTYHTGIQRPTKDLDIVVRPGESRYALDTLEAVGSRTEWPWPHFLARVLSEGEQFIDILYNSGNGLTEVDEDWFTNAVPGELLDRKVLLVPPEELLWSKCFVQERDRYDGADVAHLLLYCGQHFDWERLLRRSLGHDAVLLAQLILYDYVYPTEPRIPSWVVEELQRRIAAQKPTEHRLCRGTNLAPHQYRHDVEHAGFLDGRRQPHGPLRADEIARFTPPDAQPIR